MRIDQKAEKAIFTSTTEEMTVHNSHDPDIEVRVAWLEDKIVEG